MITQRRFYWPKFAIQRKNISSTIKNKEFLPINLLFLALHLDLKNLNVVYNKNHVYLTESTQKVPATCLEMQLEWKL